MAKYDVKFSCGHTERKELFGAEKDRQSKIEYWERSGICSECYKKAMREKEAATPLTLTINLDIVNVKVILRFEGNTMAFKDKIKELGYRWGDIPAIGLFGYFGKSQFGWYKSVSLDALDEQIKAAAELNPQVKENYTQVDLIAFAQEKGKKDKIEAKKAEMAKPKVPAKIAGKRWNGNIYGKKGNYSIYPDNEKVYITDEEAEELNNYLAAKEEYKKAITKIEAGE